MARPRAGPPASSPPGCADRTCRAPGCRRAARGCDLDHTTAWADGGATDPDNLATLCRKHHLFKHHPGNQLTQQPGGALTWTTPAGARYTTHPHQHQEPPDAEQ